jgi:transcriptional regulator with XRE-family HTH domain
MPRPIYSDHYSAFRRLLVDARSKSGLRQEDVAAKMLKPQSFISKVERGERGLDVIEFLALMQAINADPHEFIDRLLGEMADAPAE